MGPTNRTPRLALGLAGATAWAVALLGAASCTAIVGDDYTLCSEESTCSGCSECVALTCFERARCGFECQSFFSCVANLCAGVTLDQCVGSGTCSASDEVTRGVNATLLCVVGECSNCSVATNDAEFGTDAVVARSLGGRSRPAEGP